MKQNGACYGSLRSIVDNPSTGETEVLFVLSSGIYLTLGIHKDAECTRDRVREVSRTRIRGAAGNMNIQPHVLREARDYAVGVVQRRREYLRGLELLESPPAAPSPREQLLERLLAAQRRGPKHTARTRAYEHQYSLPFGAVA